MDRVRVSRAGQVFFGDREAGRLEELADESGAVAGYRFAYNPDYLTGGSPLSFNLPLSEQPYESERLSSFFENLVSEGWMRQLQSREQHIDESDTFGLLLANGRDLVGAVTVLPASAG